MIVLHHVPQARSFRALWLLEEIGADYRLVEYSFFDRSLRSAEFLKISPAGRVPALEVDGQTLFESGAIGNYLAETRAPHLDRPKGHAERGAFLEWLHFAETIGAHLSNLTQHHIALRDDHMRSPTVMRLEAARLKNCLRSVASVAGDGFVLPSGFSLVDIHLGYGVMIGARFVDYAGLPQVAAYLARLRARPGFQRALARDGVPQIYRADFYPPPAREIADQEGTDGRG
ncbi:glutathione S-transferase family protein [Roseicitreum antarcticum]|uniref:Glutathione S-transferase n=1 Tax=Roseicitreum antarcticum TaxID=564137 RepID=A0A1H2ZR11_9RHOB|nr:glutathione S-transferase [Roseicitreum antarcticum]SDX19765.1 glutathione S-transferase [Roseicitreum antarcticum]